VAEAAWPDPPSVVVAFNECINARDLDGLTSMMTDDHEFVDSAGAVVAGKAACVEAWRGFFDAFPDYRNVFASVLADGDTVTVVGRSECSEPSLVGPARWTATVRAGRIARWQVDDA
jgi:ketosteroid isomerase-like protein